MFQVTTYNFYLPLLFLTAALPFFTTTLEEYYTHVLYLPIINGAAEGCFMVGFIFILTSILGIYSYYYYHYYYYYYYYYNITIITIIIIIVIIIVNIIILFILYF